MTMSDTPNIPGALWCTGTLEVMGLLQQGLIDLGFIGGAEIDRYGNLNTSYIGDRRRPTVRLPGSGGGARHREPRQALRGDHAAGEATASSSACDFVTSPGFGDGAGWRERVGLPGGGPSAVITTLGVFRFDPDTCEMYLASYHPGQSVEQREGGDGLGPARGRRRRRRRRRPTEEELAIVRACDPDGRLDPVSAAAGPAPARGRWLMWGIPAAIFFIAFLHRVVPGVVAKDLMQAFGATGAIVGLLSSMYFYSYAGFMIPAGLLIDALGARAVIAGGRRRDGAGSLAMGAGGRRAPALRGPLRRGAGRDGHLHRRAQDRGVVVPALAVRHPRRGDGHRGHPRLHRGHVPARRPRRRRRVARRVPDPGRS